MRRVSGGRILFPVAVGRPTKVHAWPRLASDETTQAFRRWLGVRAGRVLRRSFVALAMLLLLGVAALAVVRLVYDDAIYPGVVVADVDVGGLNRTDARAVLARRAGSLEADTVSFSFGSKQWTPSLSELGASFDVEHALDAAYAIARDPNARDRLAETSALIQHDAIVPFGLRLDRSMLVHWFDQVDRDLGLPPRDAELVVDGTTARIIPDTAGTIVDRVVAERLVRTALLTLRPTSQELPVAATPAAIRQADLRPLQDRVSTMLARPLSITFEERSWALTPNDLAQFVEQRVETAGNGQPRPVVGVNDARLAAWLEARLADEIARAPVDATVVWNDGRLQAVTESVEGIRLDADGLAGAIGASLLGDQGPVRVPVENVAPAVDSHNLGKLGLTTRLAIGSSNYDGSLPDRATNVERGADLLDGTLVPPGGEFSFNQTIGFISDEAGFVEAPVIAGEQIGRDVGGGICQVSTTVFRAALLAGLPISEWHPHSFRIPFYERDAWQPGFDASILQLDAELHGGDFRFVNPTESWLLIEASYDGVNVVVDLYGRDLGYVVDLSEPTISESGLEIGFERAVFDRHGDEERRDVWESVYRGYA